MTSALPVNPFPGMNPYLERADLWPGIHNRIIAGLDRFLGPQLRPEYIVRIEQRVYVAEEPDTSGRRSYRIPDVMILDDGAATATATAVAEPKQNDEAITVQLPATDMEKENYLEVLRVDNREVVAVIELLSPTNKYGDSRREYLAKRAEVQYSFSHLVEIDLLRAGLPMPVVGDVPRSDYRILVHNARLAPDAELYVFNMRSRIPRFVLPLAKGSEGIAIDLKPVLDDVYAIGSYDRDIDYQQDPEPPLSEADRAWLDGFLRQQRLRNVAN